MIKKINNIDQFKGFIKQDIYYVRIMSLIRAYGCVYDFASFYRQINDDGVITAIISKLDGDFTLCFNDNADLAELAEFFSILGYSTVLADSSFVLPDVFDEGIVMATDKKIEVQSAYTEIDKFPKLMELFNFVDYDCLDFESWYVDISHRIRHGCAMAYTLNVNNEIISSGIFSSLYNNDAILTAVQTVPEFRKMGYGSSLVSEMICDVKGTVYLMREYNLNENFYKKLGFDNIGKWRMYK